MTNVELTSDDLAEGIRDLVGRLAKTAAEDGDASPVSSMKAEFSWTIRQDGHWFIDETNAGGSITWGPIPSRASALHVVSERRKLTERLMAVVLDALLGHDNQKVVKFIPPGQS